MSETNAKNGCRVQCPVFLKNGLRVDFGHKLKKKTLTETLWQACCLLNPFFLQIGALCVDYQMLVMRFKFQFCYCTFYNFSFFVTLRRFSTESLI